MRDIIAFILGNFTLTFFVIGLFASAIALWRAQLPRSFAMIVEALFSYFLLFSIGFSYLYNFVLHVFFGKLAASFIGWEDSPFQLEVGFASLGFAAIGFLAFRGSFDLRLAAIVGPACFLWGAAGVHVYQMITAHNFAPGNAGIIFTAISWSRLSASYFCGCNTAGQRQDRPSGPLSDGKIRLGGICICAQLVLEQKENIGALSSRCLLWKSMMVRARTATSCRAWD
jgi:hypothetical protein